MSSLVKLEWTAENTAIITMQNLGKNDITANLLYALQQTFTTIKQQSHAKAIILTGTEQYFCCSSFADPNQLLEQLPLLLLNCDLPIIAAMHGDAWGAGLVLGCYADIIILAEESIYSYAYNQEDIETSMQADYIIPKKFGTLLGNEILYTSQTYYGKDLKMRNAPLRIVKKQEVLATAYSLADDLCKKLTPSLHLLKQHLAHNIRNEMENYYGSRY